MGQWILCAFDISVVYSSYLLLDFSWSGTNEIFMRALAICTVKTCSILCIYTSAILNFFLNPLTCFNTRAGTLLLDLSIVLKVGRKKKDQF